MENTISISGKAFKLIGKPERIPMGVFNPARKLAKAALKAKGDPESTKEFFMANADTIVDISERFLQFVLGAEQYEEAEEELNKLDFVEFCTLSFDLMSKYPSMTA